MRALEGAGLGRAVMTRGAFMERGALPPGLASDPLCLARAGKLRVPADVPSALLNRVSIGIFNELCYRRGRGRARAGARPVHFDRFFFPLDRIEAWNRLYGRRGFVQYQCVLPRGESEAGSPPCWSASPPRGKAPSSGCSSCSALPGRG